MALHNLLAAGLALLVAVAHGALHAPHLDDGDDAVSLLQTDQAWPRPRREREEQQHEGDYEGKSQDDEDMAKFVAALAQAGQAKASEKAASAPAASAPAAGDYEGKSQDEADMAMVMKGLQEAQRAGEASSAAAVQSQAPAASQAPSPQANPGAEMRLSAEEEKRREKEEFDAVMNALNTRKNIALPKITDPNALYARPETSLAAAVEASETDYEGKSEDEADMAKFMQAMQAAHQPPQPVSTEGKPMDEAMLEQQLAMAISAEEDKKKAAKRHRFESGMDNVKAWAMNLFRRKNKKEDDPSYDGQ